MVILILPAQNPCPLFPIISQILNTLSLPYFTKEKWRNKELNYLLKANQLKVWRKDGMVQVSLHIIPASGYSKTRAGHSGSCHDCNPEIQPVPNMLSLTHAQISDSATAFQGYSFCQVLVSWEWPRKVSGMFVSLIYQCVVSHCAEQGHGDWLQFYI